MKEIKVWGFRETVAHFETVKRINCATAHLVVSFIGSHPNASEVVSLTNAPVLTMRVDDIVPHKSGTRERHLNVLLNHVHAREILEFCEQWNETDFRLLVHCAAGVSRSTATAIAVLVNHNYSYEEAFNTIEKMRPQLHPNPWFIEVFDEVLGERGKLLNYYHKWNSKKLLPQAIVK
jgi:predicted protein tyrosine phosphatase